MVPKHTTDKKSICSTNFSLGVLFCLLAAFLQYSCGTAPVQKKPPVNEGWLQRYTRGEISLRLQTNKKEMNIAEQLELVLETTVPENLEVVFPTYGASLGDFTLKDMQVLPARMTGTGDRVRIVHQAVYLLEPYLSGIYTIPAMTVTYRDRKNNPAKSRIITESIEISVKSLLAQGADKVTINDISPPLPLPINRTRQFLAAGLLIFLAALMMLSFLFWKKRADKKVVADIRLRPDEIAQRELDKLLADNLLAHGQFKLFHLRISDILRRYIESRFGVKAPERTTEEFLTELSRTETPNTLWDSHKTLLADFLTQCDLVKFARHEPTIGESEKTLLICREFIGKTKKKEGIEATRDRGNI